MTTTTGPIRIRTSGQRLPDGAVLVDQPSKWANPVSYSDVGAQYPSLRDDQVARMVMGHFGALAKRGSLSYPNWRFLGGRRGRVTWTYPSIEEIRRELAGRDLACSCAPDEPCHADVLLELANQ